MKGKWSISCGIAMLLLLTGCNELYQPIPKDTMMVKKINQVIPSKKIEYQGILSEDTIKRLSLDAINRLFDTHLLLENLDLDVKTSDFRQMKSMLYRIVGDTNVDPITQYEAYLNAIPNGVYRVIISELDSPYIQYTVVLNSKNGDVLEINSYLDDDFNSGKEINSGKDKAISVAEQFLKRLNDVDLDELELGDQTVLQGSPYGILFYINKSTKTRNMH